jgi:hypothetical protein
MSQRVVQLFAKNVEIGRVVIPDCPVPELSLLQYVGDEGYQFWECVGVIWQGRVDRMEIMEGKGSIGKIDTSVTIPWKFIHAEINN